MTNPDETITPEDERHMHDVIHEVPPMAPADAARIARMLRPATPAADGRTPLPGPGGPDTQDGP